MGDESVHMPAPALLTLIKLYVTVSKRFVMNSRILCLNPQHNVLKGDKCLWKVGNGCDRGGFRGLQGIFIEAVNIQQHVSLLGTPSACLTEVLRKEPFGQVYYISLHTPSVHLCVFLAPLRGRPEQFSFPKTVCLYSVGCNKETPATQDCSVSTV